VTIQGWEILLEAAILALMVVYGIYIRDLVNKQIAAKDSTIEMLRAQISALQANTAPAIVKDYATMRDYADKTTEEKNRLQEELQAEMMRFQVQMAKATQFSQAMKVVSDASSVLSLIEGSLDAQQTVHAELSVVLFPESRKAPEATYETLQTILTRYLNALSCSLSARFDRCSPAPEWRLERWHSGRAS
jgi:hypothetical protein